MSRTSTFCLALLLITRPGFAQTGSPDALVTQTLLSEIRQLRSDLQTTAATIQRVQIVMYRLQAETAQLNRATERRDGARAECNLAQDQRQMLTTQIEHAEAQQRNSQNPAGQKAAEEMLANLRSSVQVWAGKEQQCQVEQADAETQFRTEQAKMSDLQGQLDRLDQILAGRGTR